MTSLLEKAKHVPHAEAEPLSPRPLPDKNPLRDENPVDGRPADATDLPAETPNCLPANEYEAICRRCPTWPRAVNALLDARHVPNGGVIGDAFFDDLDALRAAWQTARGDIRRGDIRSGNVQKERRRLR